MASPSKQPRETHGFRHHVYFWLKEPANKQHRREFLRELRKMIEIDVIEEYAIGVPADTPREVVDNSWTYDWQVRFANREAWAVYNDHPVHLEFVERTSEYRDREKIYDSLPAVQPDIETLKP